MVKHKFYGRRRDPHENFPRRRRFNHPYKANSAKFSSPQAHPPEIAWSNTVLGDPVRFSYPAVS